MQIGAVILTRYDSSRLPGKALADVCGKPLLWYSLDRVRAIAGIEKIVIATSDRDIDDPIAEFACCEDVPVFRGDVDDVAGRFVAAAEELDLDVAARINADCPLLHISLLNQACQIMREDNLDFVTNLMPRTYPYGIVVEMFQTRAFRTGYKLMEKPEHFEHVTKFFYDYAENYHITNLTCAGCKPEEMLRYRFTIDTPANLAAFRRFVREQLRPWPEVDFYDAIRFGSFDT